MFDTSMFIKWSQALTKIISYSVDVNSIFDFINIKTFVFISFSDVRS